MPSELRGPGKKGARLHFDRTQVTLEDAGKVTVIPLDQVDHVAAGKEPGQVLFLVVAAVGLVGGVLGWYFQVALGSLSWVYLALGGVLFAAGIAGFFLQRPRMVRIDSGSGQVALPVPPKQAKRAAAFVRDLMAARTTFLEGVYEEE